MDKTIGIIGTGNIGLPILFNLKDSGVNVVSYARRDTVIEAIKEKGIEVTGTPKELAQKADIIFDILNDANSTLSVLNNDDMLSGLSEGKIWVDMTTSDPDESVPIGELLSSKGVYYIDCPITGGKKGAVDKQLVCMAAGDESAFKELEFYLNKISKKVFYLGKIGNGHYMKLIHNQLSHSTFLAACEAVNLGKALGLDPEVMIDVFNSGNARSYATEVRFPEFILPETYNAGASFKTVQKDIGIVIRKIESLGMSMPVSEAAYRYWCYAVDKGMEDADYSTIYRLIGESAD